MTLSRVVLCPLMTKTNINTKNRRGHRAALTVILFAAADAVWDAGDRYGRLAEEHHL